MKADRRRLPPARYAAATLGESMWFKHRAWVPVAWLLSLANLVAVWFAAQPAEPWHATVHSLLAVLFALGAQRLMARQRSPADQNRLDQLQQSVDVVALEVERISEGQRYVTRLLDETLRPSINSGEAQPIAVNRKDITRAQPNEEL